jgi:predicted GH43/DUF377 family glycosyl hydrolase
MRKTKSKVRDDYIPQGVGITTIDKSNIFLFSKVVKGRDKAFLQIATSPDGFNFKTFPQAPTIYDEEKGKEEDIKKCENFQIVKKDQGYLLIYKLLKGKGKHVICVATSDDLIHWKKIGKLPKVEGLNSIVPDYKFRGKHVLFFGEKSIKVAFSKDMEKWKASDEPVLEPRDGYFDSHSIEVGNCVTTNEGIFLIFNVKDGTNAYQSTGIAVFDKKDPKKLLWRSQEAIWRRYGKWKDRIMHPIGGAQVGGNLIYYWNVEGEGVKAIVFSAAIFSPVLSTKTALEKPEENPILKPRPDHAWESKATFNPAAVHEGGKVHIVYRAIGDSDTSVLGYASSKDGVRIEERSKKPIFEWKEYPKPSKSSTPCVFCSPMAGWGGGCEDPRITKIDDRLYMCYTAFDGNHPPRVALTSIKVEDFVNKKWNWEKPVFISPPDETHKNWVIFPEKVKGKYAILHSISPEILIDYFDSLEFDGKTYIKSHYRSECRDDCWDSFVRGVGPPPIKTKDGWLLFYNAIDDRDPGRYKLGAMLLDLENPTKVLHRCDYPVLEPVEMYENEGFKSGVVYPCGAVVIDDQLFVYYGSADSYVCVAKTNLDEFLSRLKHSHPARLKPVMMQSK